MPKAKKGKLLTKKELKNIDELKEAELLVEKQVENAKKHLKAKLLVNAIALEILNTVKQEVLRTKLLQMAYCPVLILYFAIIAPSKHSNTTTGTVTKKNIGLILCLFVEFVIFNNIVILTKMATLCQIQSYPPPVTPCFPKICTDTLKRISHRIQFRQLEQPCYNSCLSREFGRRRKCQVCR